MKARRFKMAIFALAICAAFSGIVMLLWNMLIPGIFGLATINFWQALGLLVLTRILFGGFGGGRKMMMGHGFGGGMHEHNPFREKWMKMTPEERKAFIKKRHDHAFGGPFGRDDFFRDDFDTKTTDDSKKNG